MIKFNIPPRTGEESKYIEDAIESEKICGDGKYTKLCQEILEKKFNSKKIYVHFLSLYPRINLIPR